MKVKIDPDKFPSKYLRDYPQFLSQLHPELNQNKNLNILLISSRRAVLTWVCPEGHIYKMSLRSKILKNRNCQECLKILSEEKKKFKEKKPRANQLDISYEKVTKDEIKKRKKASDYRFELEPFIGTAVVLHANSFEIDSSNPDYDRILLRDVQMIEASKRTTELVDGTLPKIDHLWTRVDKDFKIRNDLEELTEINLRGIVYRYITLKHYQNIGFRILCLARLKE